MAMTEYEIETLKQQRLIAGYECISRFNIHDNQAVLAFDKIFVPVALLGVGTALAKYADYYYYAYIGGGLLLTFWLVLSWRYRNSIDLRFSIMDYIEHELDVRAGRLFKQSGWCCVPADVQSEIGVDGTFKTRNWLPRDRDARAGFYVLAIIAGGVAGWIHPRVLPEKSYCFWIVTMIVGIVFPLLGILLARLAELFRTCLKSR